VNATNVNDNGKRAECGRANVEADLVERAVRPSRSVANVPDEVITVTPRDSNDFFRSSSRSICAAM
jgi:hypothetical protein